MFVYLFECVCVCVGVLLLVVIVFLFSLIKFWSQGQMDTRKKVEKTWSCGKHAAGVMR